MECNGSGRVRRRSGCCGNITVECGPTTTWTAPTAAYVNSEPLAGIQCDPVVTYETVVEPTVYYTLADVENTHYVKHIVPVVYQQTIKNVTQHEYVMENTLDQSKEEIQVGFEQNVAGLVSTPCNAPQVSGAVANVAEAPAALAGAGQCCNVIVQCR